MVYVERAFVYPDREIDGDQHGTSQIMSEYLYMSESESASV